MHRIDYNKLDWGSDFAFYDVNDDCQITNGDINQVHSRLGKTVYDQQYNSRYDLNSDGVINTTDESAVQAQFNKTCPTFTYDADSNLTKLEGPKNIVYIGGIYEKNLDTGEVNKHYAADGRRIAMRKGANLYYFAGDNLGSTSIAMDSNGTQVSKTRYYPYGNVWTQETGSSPTDKLFTGQRRYGSKSGIYSYGARFYSADIGRFL